MSAWDKKAARIKEDSGPLSFSDVKLVCDRLFGPPRTHGSHLIYKNALAGRPTYQHPEPQRLCLALSSKASGQGDCTMGGRT